MKITIQQNKIKNFEDVEIGEVFEWEDDAPCLKIDEDSYFNLRSSFICEINYDEEVTVLDSELIIRK